MLNISPQKTTACFNTSKICGEIFTLPHALTIEQQAISLRIASALLQHVQAMNLGRVLQTPSGVLLSKQRIQPDILFVARERRGIIGETALYAAPDMIVDILSPRFQGKDFRVKKRLYEFFKVREYWIANPDDCTVEVLVWSELGYIPIGRYGKRDNLSTPLLPNLDLRLSIIFATEED